jgi:arylsulfatase A-like enzyme
MQNLLVSSVVGIVLTGCHLLASSPVAAAAPGTPDTRPRNVVLIISDDQHWRDYAFLGHPHLRTPALDRLARESLVFPHGYVPSSLCCPSLASIITGRYPHEHRIVGNDPPEKPGVGRNTPEGKKLFADGRDVMNRHLGEWPLLPQLLAAKGYASLQTGKWWQGHFSHGGFTEGMTQGGRHGDDGLAIGRKTMQPVYDFVGRCREQRKPFLVWYAPMLPHDPHDPGKELVDHYAGHTDSIHVAKYWGNVERFDRSVGDLLEYLDREGLAKDTLVVYVTDNGWITNPEQGRFAPKSKLSPYDGGLRTPIMLRQPGAIKPRVSEAVASSLDIMPTVLAACGVPAAAGLPGVNLLDEKAVDTRKQLFGECFTHTLSDLDDPAQSLLWRWTVRQEPGGRVWKLIVPTTAAPAAGLSPPSAAGSYWATRMNDSGLQQRYERGEIELYDVAADPDETHNVASSHPDIVSDLTQSLDAWWTPVPRKP